MECLKRIYRVNLVRIVGKVVKILTAVGFEPTSTNTSELESDPLDHSGILSITHGEI